MDTAIVTIPTFIQLFKIVFEGPLIKLGPLLAIEDTSVNKTDKVTTFDMYCSSGRR